MEVAKRSLKPGVLVWILNERLTTILQKHAEMRYVTFETVLLESLKLGMISVRGMPKSPATHACLSQRILSSQLFNTRLSCMQTIALRECMLAHKDYYQPLLDEEEKEMSRQEEDEEKTNQASSEEETSTTS